MRGIVVWHSHQVSSRSYLVKHQFEGHSRSILASFSIEARCSLFLSTASSLLAMGTRSIARQAKNPHPSLYRRKSTTFQPCSKILTRFIILIHKIREPFLRRNRRRKPVLRTPTIPPLPWKILFAWKFCKRRIWQHSYKLQKRN